MQIILYVMSDVLQVKFTCLFYNWFIKWYLNLVIHIYYKKIIIFHFRLRNRCFGHEFTLITIVFSSYLLELLNLILACIPVIFKYISTKTSVSTIAKLWAMVLYSTLIMGKPWLQLLYTNWGYTLLFVGGLLLTEAAFNYGCCFC